LVLVMSVFPGFGGQKFIPDALDKIKTLDTLRRENGFSFEIEVDGGITQQNLQLVLDAGVNIVVAGSSIFNQPDVEQTTREFIDLALERVQHEK